MALNEQDPNRAFIMGDGDTALRIVIKGRVRWALEALIRAGSKGCTPIDNPAPRWAAYVHKLRKLGVSVETVHEIHQGPFPGNHARYVLACAVTPAPEGGDA